MDDVRAWETGQLNHLSNSVTDLWRNLKGWLGWKNSGPPTKLINKNCQNPTYRVLTDTINFKAYYMMLFDIIYLLKLRTNTIECKNWANTI